MKSVYCIFLQQLVHFNSKEFNQLFIFLFNYHINKVCEQLGHYSLFYNQASIQWLQNA